MATIPSRADIVRRAVNSLIDQVDSLRIVFNEYSEIPSWALEIDKIFPLLNAFDEHTSSAVWLLMDGVDGYVLVVDDDILYPSDYVDVMSHKLDEYGRHAALTLHGTIFKRPFLDFEKDREVIHFESALESDLPVHLGGVGCSAFHTDHFYPMIHEFPDKYSRDPWFAIKAAREGLPVICISRPKGWLVSLRPEGVTIWQKVLKDSELRSRKNHVVSQYLLPLLQ